FISVAVPIPFLDLLTYRVPEHLELPSIGARVRVPVGTRTVTGCVVEHGVNGHAPEGLKDIGVVLDREPFLPPNVVDLCRWVADYYLAGIGDAIAAAMPPGARTKASSFRTRRVASLTAHGMAVAQDPAADRLTERQRRALEVLHGATALALSDLRERGITSDVLTRLAARGLVTLRGEADERDPFERSVLAGYVPDATRRLTTEQADAFGQLGALADSGEFRVALLHGVTGSGKTEIYARLADQVKQRGRQTLLMVPEIALTPSVAALFRHAFGDRVAIQHSGLSDGERHDQWHRIRRGDVDVVVGTRSAVFVPLSRLGLIVVDEEHDTSYKQEEAPRYHGRDVAVVRAQRERALVVLGSATPSMETFQHAESGKYVRATLTRRVLDRPLAAVSIVNMREEYKDEGPDIVISRALAAAIEDRLTRREQVLVLLNRRGYATAVLCRQCGDTFECPNCTISLTVHTARNGWRARCHYCNYSTMVPKACRKCAAPYLEHAGFGTERVEQHLRDRFPDARIGRVDRDSVRRKGALTSLLSRFAAGDLDVLVGTQMIAKGHDFPRVTLVGVISADVGLGLADFRAAERTFQLLTQVAGRAGRGERTGEAIVQTLYPEHYSIQLACRQDYPAFFEKELIYRRTMRYPPAVALVNAVVRGRSFDDAMQTATDLVRRLEPAGAVGGFLILGPAPAPLMRLRGEHRVQFFMKGARRADMRLALKAVLAQMPDIRRRVTVDVDPLSVL
ncbi:MAG TPA: primosomal protein N', partial [Vicinamibacterales bacterium]|nr:primosomal protein N' [Vicinamibacterales bacterium]